MTTFLFWNVQRKPLDGHIVELVRTHDVDVLCLVEHLKPDQPLFQQLNAVHPYDRVTAHSRFGVYTRFSPLQFKRLQPPTSSVGNRVDYWSFDPGMRHRLLLVLVHGPDMRNHDGPTRSLFFERVHADVRWFEANEPGAKQKNTVILGDFNADPFEEAVAGVRGLHALPVKDVGRARSRSVMRQKHEFFCNPMWGQYRGWENPPQASYYFNRGAVLEHFWHMLDQVVFRPSVVRMFKEQDLRIVTHAGPRHLLTNRGLPDKATASDHLPVVFKLNLNAR